MNLDEFEALTRRRRAVRHFKPDPIADDLLHRLLDAAHWAPSGYNLQPTHFVIAKDAEIKEELWKACLQQRQVKEAPATIVFTGDRNVVENHFETIIAMERETGAINPDYEKLYRTFVPLAFSHAPAGLGWLWKAAILPLLQFFRPIPNMPAVHKRYWLAKQTLLSAMVFMLAAESAGLATAPMEGFDERRVKKVLKIPASHIVPLVISIGYAQEGNLIKTRLPVKQLIHENSW
ncbi:MAG: hypothetical protein C4527_00730 [Candidatus Omnitrophota bacterium]|jgi:nitroreductase|nr:MAG: hypothetical protein C4527_00730 [Candidatus Omnitrophota bacterium]